MHLLNINLNESLQNVLVNAESSLKTTLDPVFNTVYQSCGVFVAIGVLLTILVITMQMMIGGELSVDKFAKMMVFYLLFANSKELLEIADALFQLPANALDKQFAIKTQQSGGSLVAAYKDAVIQNIDDSHNLGTISPTAMVEKMPVYIGYTISTICTVLYDLALFLIKFVSILGARILIAFSPIAFAVSLLPGFEGSLVGLLKYIFVIRLWAAIGAGLKLAFYGVGLLHVFEQQRGMIDSGVGTSWDWSICALQLVFLLCTVLIPTFADALISGSQSGGFFSASVGWGLSTAQSVTKDATNLVSGAFKSGGAGASSTFGSGEGGGGVLNAASGDNGVNSGNNANTTVSNTPANSGGYWNNNQTKNN